MVGQSEKYPLGVNGELRQGWERATLPVDSVARQGQNESDRGNVGYILKG